VRCRGDEEEPRFETNTGRRKSLIRARPTTAGDVYRRPGGRRKEHETDARVVRVREVEDG
jgi:hypothetical protein